MPTPPNHRKPTKSALRNRAETVFSTLAQQNPAPRTELHYHNVFTLLVAVVLSAQATDKGVNKATTGLFAIADTPEKMVALGLEGIIHHVRTIGLYQAKAKNVLALSRLLIERHNSIVPADRDALEQLPGVGRKTANVVLNEAFGQPTIAVDTHIFRLSRRLGFSTGTTPLAVEKDLLAIVPPRWLQHAHHWLILHGRYICKARQPNCAACSIRAYCPSATITSTSASDIASTARATP